MPMIPLQAGAQPALAGAPEFYRATVNGSGIRTKSSAEAGIRSQLANLRTFLAVAEAKSIKGASDLLFRAPSAITRSIIQLERSLGVSLFERKSRGMLINTSGKLVLSRALRIQDEIELAAQELLSADPKPTRSSLGAVTSMLFNGRKLELVVQLGELHSISNAAVRMGMTQSGASMALCRIEAVLGQALFHRRIEGMMATEVAERLVVRARRVFAELRNMISDICTTVGDLTGTVVIGTTRLGRPDFLPQAVAKALSRYPGLRVSTVESPHEHLIGGLRSGEIDIGLGVSTPNQLGRDIVAEPLFLDRLSVVARAGHPLAGRSALHVADLLNERWILPRPSGFGRRLVDEAFRELGLAPPVPVVETGDLSMIRQLLSSSDMLALTSPDQVALELRTGVLVELSALSGATREVALFLREGAVLSVAGQMVLEAVREQARNG
jgi:LysR family transcriptional regulator of gallate degradation